MGTKRTKKEEAPTPAAKQPPKRKMAVRPATPVTPPKPAAKAAAKAAPKQVAKPAPKAKKPAPAPTVVTETATVVEISLDAIALRAYFISEARQGAGIPGDSTTDWLEAEKQLRAEL